MKEIPLVGNKGLAMVDDEDYERVSPYRWYRKISGSGNIIYAVTYHIYGWREKDAPMHRFILGLRESLPKVDHRNLNGLDNQKTNLRLATDSQNGANREVLQTKTSSQYKGVYPKGDTGWIVQIRHHGKPICGGTYETEEMAAAIYNQLATELFGEYALLNQLSHTDIPLQRRLHPKDRTECRRGHPYDEANTVWWMSHGKKHRYCRICEHEKAAARRRT